jgi:ABC-type polysaccharide transport system permease subunit
MYAAIRWKRKGRGYEKIIYNTVVYIIQNDGFEIDGIEGSERWMQIEDRTEGKGKESQKYI